MILFGTSIPEQIIFFELRKIFPDALSRFKEDHKEIDIYLPNLKIGIEYDGVYYHQFKVKQDNSKNLFLNQLGIYVIRIREVGLPTLDPFNGVCIESDAFVKNFSGYEDLRKLLIKIMLEIGKAVPDLEYRYNVNDINFSNEELNKDILGVYSNIYKTKVDNNLLSCCGIEMWNLKKNSNLNPENISLETSLMVRANFTCPNGNNIMMPISFLISQSSCDHNCSLCRSNYCVLIPKCKFACEKKTKYLFKCFTNNHLTNTEVVCFIYDKQASTFLLNYLLNGESNDKKLAIQHSLFYEKFNRLYFKYELIWPDKIEDFELIKKIEDRFNCFINFDISKFDNIDNRYFIISYLENCLYKRHEPFLDLLARLHIIEGLKNKTISESLARYFVKMLKYMPDAEKYEYHSIK